TSAAGTNSAAPWRRRAPTKTRGGSGWPAPRDGIASAPARSLRRLPYAGVARHVEEDLFQIGAAVTRQQAHRRGVINDDALFHHDHVLTHALDLGHVVRRE